MYATAITHFDKYSDRVLGPLEHVPEFGFPTKAPRYRVAIGTDKDGWRKVTVNAQYTFVDAVRHRLTLELIVAQALHQLGLEPVGNVQPSAA